jgi:hypothetical protein
MHSNVGGMNRGTGAALHSQSLANGARSNGSFLSHHGAVGNIGGTRSGFNSGQSLAAHHGSIGQSGMNGQRSFLANHGAGGNIGLHNAIASRSGGFGTTGAGHPGLAGASGNSFAARHGGTTIVNNRINNISNNYAHGGFQTGGFNRLGNQYGRYGYGLGYGLRGNPYGYGWGYGYPYYGYGFGRGLWSGLLYGLSGYGGYGGYGYGGGYGNWGYGYGGGYGNWGYGYPGYGYGGYCYPSYGGYGNYGMGYGYSPYANVVTSAPVTAVTTTAEVPASTASASNSFAQQGEAAFKSGDYSAAAYAFQHAVVDNSQNPVLILMHAQALFASGKFQEAAGATQAAMTQLPKDQWGVVVSNYREFYGKIGDYTTQLRALEAAAKDKPNDPAIRFLLGYHYGYLGYPQQAVDQLKQATSLAPDDTISKQLRDEMQSKLPTPSIPAAPVVPPSPSNSGTA